MVMPRKSVQTHTLQGTRPHYDPANVTESHIAGGRPRVPAHLTPGAKKKFREFMKLLEQRRALTPADGSMLELAARLWDRWQDAMRHVDAEGLILSVTCYSKNGDEYQRDKKNLYLVVAQETEKSLVPALAQLGLNVLARDKSKPVGASSDPVVGEFSKITTADEWIAYEKKHATTNS